MLLFLFLHGMNYHQLEKAAYKLIKAEARGVAGRAYPNLERERNVQPVIRLYGINIQLIIRLYG